MAVYSILKREGTRTFSPPSDSSSPIGSDSSHAPDTEPAGQEPPFVNQPSAEPPIVALELPDLAAAEILTTVETAPSGARSRIASLAYWTGISLGAVLALVLIWSPQKAAVRSMDEAPAWSPSASGQSDAAASPRDSMCAGQSRAQPPAPGDPSYSSNPCQGPQAAPPCHQPPSSSSEQPARTIGGPLIQNGDAPQCPAMPDAPPQVRTASNPGAHWDGSSGHARPSEAAPLGITTPVSQ